MKKDKFNINSPALKKFLVRVGIGAIPVWALLCWIIYFGMTMHRELTGDLGWLGKIDFGREYEARMQQEGLGDTMVVWYPDVPQLHRVGVIGDSFSRQYPSGYTSALGKELGDTVSFINFNDDVCNPVEGAVALLNDGFFDRDTTIKTMVIETVERRIPVVWENLNFGKEHDSQVLNSVDPCTFYSSNYRFQNELTAIQRNAVDRLKLTSGIAENPVKHAALVKPAFRHDRYASDLFFYRDDLGKTDLSEEELSRIREHMEQLHNMFAERGIEMVMLIVPDKYEVYQDMIADNPYPRQHMGALLEQGLGDLDYVVNATSAIKQMAESGEKDVFLANDSHWSPKAATVAAAMVAEKIR